MLCRLRLGLLEQDLAYQFQLSQTSISRICTTWINFCYVKFKGSVQWKNDLGLYCSLVLVMNIGMCDFVILCLV